jgi:hypothetical protein
MMIRSNPILEYNPTWLTVDYIISVFIIIWMILIVIAIHDHLTGAVYV